MQPALQSCAGHDWDRLSVSQESFSVEFRKAAECVAQHLKDQPVIVAHSENTFDGSGVKRLLSNKFELDKVYTLIKIPLFLSRLKFQDPSFIHGNYIINRFNCALMDVQILNAALENMPKDRNGKVSKECLRVALDVVAPSAGLPPIGVVEEVCCYCHS